jgi:hypothetical protein
MSFWNALQVLELVGDHQNIAALKSAFEDRDYVYFILELCKGGELFDRIVAEVRLAGPTPKLVIMKASIQLDSSCGAHGTGHVLGKEGCAVLPHHGGGHPPLPSAGGHPPVCAEALGRAMRAHFGPPGHRVTETFAD